jgi:hypothetical protein
VVEKSHDSRLPTPDCFDDEPRDLEELVERQNRGRSGSRTAVGEIEIDKNGRMRKRTNWGWDYSADALD